MDWLFLGLQVPILSRALAHSLAVDIDHTRVRPGKRVSEQHMKYLSSVVQSMGHDCSFFEETACVSDRFGKFQCSLIRQSHMFMRNHADCISHQLGICRMTCE